MRVRSRVQGEPRPAPRPAPNQEPLGCPRIFILVPEDFLLSGPAVWHPGPLSPPPPPPGYLIRGPRSLSLETQVVRYPDTRLSLKVCSESAPDITPPSKFPQQQAQEASPYAPSFSKQCPHCPDPGHKCGLPTLSERLNYPNTFFSGAKLWVPLSSLPGHLPQCLNIRNLAPLSPQYYFQTQKSTIPRVSGENSDLINYGIEEKDMYKQWGAGKSQILGD